MIALAWNGTGFDPADGISPADRGFRYGMSLFETVAVFGGRPRFVPEHRARLAAAATRVGMPLDNAPLDAAEAWLKTAPFRDGVVRWYLTAGPGAPSAPVASPGFLVLAEERAPIAAEARARGYRIAFWPEPYLAPFGGLKTANYWANAAAITWAKERGCDEAILADPHGLLVSASMANLFLRIEGRWVTPDRASRARDGVVRAFLLERGLAAEVALASETLARAESAFLTSSWLGIMPVRALRLGQDDRTLEPPGPAFDKLAEELCM